jgi:hypothetical protein
MPDHRSPAGYDAHFADRRAIEEEAHKREHQARRELTESSTAWFDAHKVQASEMCWKAGHVPLCPGFAGGDHELLPGWISIGDPDEGYAVEVETT